MQGFRLSFSWGTGTIISATWHCRSSGHIARGVTKPVCPEYMMLTTLNIDDETLRFVQEETGARTKTQAVHEGLRDFVRRKKIENLIQLAGKVGFSSDAKTLRKGWERKHRSSR